VDTISETDFRDQSFFFSEGRGGGRRENRQHFGVFGEIVNITFSSHFKTF